MLFIVTCLLILKDRRVQTYITNEIVARISSGTNLTIKVGNTNLSPITSLLIQEITVADEENRIITIGRAKVDLISVISQLINNPKDGLTINKISLENALIKVIRKKGEDNFNISKLTNLFKRNSTDNEQDFTFITKELVLSKINIQVIDENYDGITSGFNPGNIYAKIPRLEIKNLATSDKRTSFEIRHFEFEEKSGFQLKSLTTTIAFTSTSTVLDNLVINLPHSRFSSSISLAYSSFEDFSSFSRKVRFDMKDMRAKVGLEDVACFLPASNRKHNLHFSALGNLKGKISDLVMKDFEIGCENIKMNADFRLRGLPEINQTFIHANVKNFNINKIDINKVVGVFSENDSISKIIDTALGPILKFSVKGKFTGFVNDFVAYSVITTDFGTIRTDATLKTMGNDDKIVYKGKLSIDDLEIGKIYNIDQYVGKIDGEFDIDGAKAGKDVSASLDGKFRSLNIHKYAYQDVQVKGQIINKKFNGLLNLNDRNVKLDFTGLVDFNESIPSMNGVANIKNARLDKLNLFADLDSSITVSSTILMNFSGNNIDNFQGAIHIRNSQIKQGSVTYDIKTFAIVSEFKKSFTTLNLLSDFLNVDISGNFRLSSLVGSYSSYLSGHIPALSNFLPPVNTGEPTTPQYVKSQILIKDKRIWDLFLPPSITIEDNIQAGISFDSDKHLFNSKIETNHLKYRGFDFHDNIVEITGDSAKMELYIRCDEIKMNDSSMVSHIMMKSHIADSLLNYTINWNSVQGNPVEDSKLEGTAKLEPGPKVNLTIHSPEFYVDGDKWSIPIGNLIAIDSNSIHFGNLIVINDQQKLALNGILSAGKNDKINIALSNFNISNINKLIAKENYLLDGIADGNLTVSSVLEKPVISAGLNITHLALNDWLLGDLSLRSKWNGTTETVEIDAKVTRGDFNTIEASGFYFPYRKQENFDGKIKLNKTRLNVLNPYLKSWISNINGIATGELLLTGELASPVLEGSLNLQRVGFKVKMLNTTYNFTDVFEITRDKILIDNLIINDKDGNQAIATGYIGHEYFSNLNIDLGIDLQNLLCLNTTFSDNSSFYGRAYASGALDIDGPVENIKMVITAKSGKNSHFYIPLENPEEIGSHGYISFVNSRVQEVDSLMRQPVPKKSTGPDIQCNFEITPDAEIQIVFDSKIGDIIKCTGHGNLELLYDRLGDMSLSGQYFIDRGDYLFTLQNIINKRFFIEKGGYIKWMGDPMKATVSLESVYKLKASIDGIIADSNLVGKRIPVECRLILSDDLLSPDIKLDIAFPTLDALTKNQLYAILKLHSEDELNKQIFSLLVLNRFVDLSAQNENLDIGVRANSMELLSNQISNWLSQISKDFDIGVNYQSGKDISDKQLEVALSTQLFNDRISVDGNFDVGNNNNSSNLVGDFSLEYMVSKDGKFRVKAFNKSAENLNQLKSEHTNIQGLGLTYRREFNTLKDLIINKKRNNE